MRHQILREMYSNIKENLDFEFGNWNGGDIMYAAMANNEYFDGNYN